MSAITPIPLMDGLLEEGCSFRYPVSYEDKDDMAHKTRYKVENMDKDHINSIRYVFGSNNLFIGSAIVKVLERLEQKYDLDFDKLVKNHKQETIKGKCLIVYFNILAL